MEAQFICVFNGETRVLMSIMEYRNRACSKEIYCGVITEIAPVENNTTTTTALRVCYPSGSKHLGLGSPRYLVRSDMAEAYWRHRWRHHPSAPRPSRGDYYQATSDYYHAYLTSPR